MNNGEHKEIYDSLTELKTTTAEICKDIKYIKEKVEDNKEDREALEDRVFNNEKKIYLATGAVAVVLALTEVLPVALKLFN